MAGRGAVTTDTFDQVLNHLQFLGYETSRKDEVVTAKHRTKRSIMMKAFRGGILSTAIVGCNDHAKSHKAGYLRFINLLNSKASVARFYADADSDYDLLTEAWYPDFYDRSSFGIFWEAWDTDSRTLLLVEHRDEVVKYLS